MKPSQILIDAVKGFEGYRYQAELDTISSKSDCWTIGYGMTMGVRQGDTMTEAVATDWLIRILENYGGQIERMLDPYTPALTQGEYDALTDFCYNLGTSRLIGSTLLHLVLMRSDSYSAAAIPAEFRKWNMSGGIVRAGLIKRREWDVERWLTV